MKDKILCWIDIDIEQFGIIKFLREKYPCDLYAIIDINLKTKNFFLDQKIVQFEKIWFYRDYLSSLSKKPDTQYLSEIEKKYNINLWQIAYSERYFLDYNPFYKFSYNEIISLLEQECRFFEKVLEEVKPHFLLTKVTDYHQNHLFHQMCRSLGIQVLMYGKTRIGGLAMISQDFDRLDITNTNLDQNHEMKSFDELRNYVKKYSKQQLKFRNVYRTSLTSRINCGIQFLINCNDEYRTYFANYGRIKFKVLYTESLFLLKRWLRKKFLDKNCSKVIKTDSPFVYFPMHFEPERAILISAPYYTNQLEVIRHVAKSIPINYKLFVKDHPGMYDTGWHSIDYYKKIKEIPNIELLHPETSDEELIKNSSLVITIAGTSSISAAFYEKPSMVFAETVFSPFLLSVKQIKNIEELPKDIRISLSTKVKLSDLNKYIKLAEINSFPFDYFELYSKVNNFFYRGGFLKDVKISEEAMKSFLEGNKQFFEKLAIEHIKKIEDFKSFVD